MYRYYCTAVEYLSSIYPQCNFPLHILPLWLYICDVMYDWSQSTEEWCCMYCLYVQLHFCVFSLRVLGIRWWGYVRGIQGIIYGCAHSISNNITFCFTRVCANTFFPCSLRCCFSVFSLLASGMRCRLSRMDVLSWGVYAIIMCGEAAWTYSSPFSNARWAVLGLFLSCALYGMSGSLWRNRATGSWYRLLLVLALFIVTVESADPSSPEYVRKWVSYCNTSRIKPKLDRWLYERLLLRCYGADELLMSITASIC